MAKRKAIDRVGSLDGEAVARILSLAERIQESPGDYARALERRTLALLFMQESTRTRVGFTVAMHKLGGTTVEVTKSRTHFTMTQAESLADTVRVVSAYADVLALRHPDAGALEIAMENCDVPLINCGNGTDEHPTQALVDAFAIKKAFGAIENLRVQIVGDLASMRAAHSLFILLTRFPKVRVELVSPPEKRMPRGYLETAGPGSASVVESDTFDPATADVVYMAGYPRREAESREGDATGGRFLLTVEKAKSIKPGAVILSPLPRIDEIERGVDSLPQAQYFRQSARGLFVRMAVLLFLLADTK